MYFIQSAMGHYLESNPDLNFNPDLRGTLPGAEANLTLLMYLTSPAAKLDALDRLISLPSLQSKVTKAIWFKVQ